jgi:flavin reductase (DIM6/NTAB) family NADH-FMN oxidoreductase RutF
MSPPPVDPTAFRRALGCFPSGIVVVTVRDAKGVDHGMTVSAFCSASLEPPLVLACIGHDATIAGAVAAASTFGVSVLADNQSALSRRFAEPDADRFDGLDVTRGSLGVALVPGALAHLECRVTARHEAGDHTIVVGEVLAAKAHAGRALAYFRGDYAHLDR